MAERDPFSVLGMAPSLERAAVKAAYFAAVRRTPPHIDPEAFKRVREAYEALSDDNQRVLAYLRAPLDVDAELAGWRERFEARIEAVRAQRQTSDEQARTLQRLLDCCAKELASPR